jgi:hypothetical protein
MTRKDYIMLAENLRWARENTPEPAYENDPDPVMLIAARLADRIHDDNPRFDPEHFLAVVRGERELNSRPPRKKVA